MSSGHVPTLETISFVMQRSFFHVSMEGKQNVE